MSNQDTNTNHVIVVIPRQDPGAARVYTIEGAIAELGDLDSWLGYGVGDATERTIELINSGATSFELMCGRGDLLFLRRHVRS